MARSFVSWVFVFVQLKNALIGSSSPLSKSSSSSNYIPFFPFIFSLPARVFLLILAGLAAGRRPHTHLLSLAVRHAGAIG